MADRFSGQFEGLAEFNLFKVVTRKFVLVSQGLKGV